MIMPTAGVLIVVLYGAGTGGAKTIGVSLMVAAGAFTAGGLVGFLFGIPRALSTNSDSTGGGEARFRSNSNLEQISDWLTKILVGVGLVEIGQIGQAGSGLVRSLAPALGGGPTGRAFAAGLLVFFAGTGFAEMYFATRVFLGLVFSATEYDLQHGEHSQQAQSPNAPPSPLTAASTDRNEDREALQQ